MFTGIIEDTAKIVSATPEGDSVRFSVKPVSQRFLKGIKTGDSISINGACMTVERIIKGTFDFTTIKESLKKTNLGSLKKEAVINLEKAMTLNSQLDGHIVQGHVDVTGVIETITKQKGSLEFFIKFPAKYSDNIIEVGSIAINGVSLTIAEIVRQTKIEILIKVAIVPHTFANTNFRFLGKGSVVNIEFDIIGKYVKRILGK